MKRLFLKFLVTCAFPVFSTWGHLSYYLNYLIYYKKQPHVKVVFSENEVTQEDRNHSSTVCSPYGP